MRRGPVIIVVLLVMVALAPAQAAAAEMVTLTVAVVDDAGQPVSGATINATWSDGNSVARTASNGKAFVDVPVGATVAITVEHDDYVRNAPLLLSDASAREVTLDVSRKGSGVVRVTDSDGTVSGVSVNFQEDGRTVVSGTTNAKGVLATGVIEQGQYDLVLSKPGYYRNVTSVEITGDVQRSLEMRRGTVTLTFDVRDDHFAPARGLDDAVVSVGDRGDVRTTDGRATFSVPVNTQFAISATKDGYETATREYRVGESDTSLTLTIQREKRITVEPASERIVVGEQASLTVTNAYDEPIRGAKVTVDGDVVGETNAGGTITFPIEQEGNVTVRAQSGSARSDGLTLQGVAVSDANPTDTQDDSSPTETTSVDLPGFGALPALVGLAFALFALRRR